jgi:hypothetical protein
MGHRLHRCDGGHLQASLVVFGAGLTIALTAPALSINTIIGHLEFSDSFALTAMAPRRPGMLLAPMFSISARMSAERQTVILGESFSGCGNRPIFTPFHRCFG